MKLTFSSLASASSILVLFGATLNDGLMMWVSQASASSRKDSGERDQNLRDRSLEKQKDIINYCLDRDYSKIQGTIQQNNAYKSDPRWLQSYLRGVYPAYAGIDRVIEQSAHALSYLGPDTVPSAAQLKRGENAAVYEVIKKGMIRKAKRDHLNDYQRACMVQCVSSRIITYDPGIALALSTQSAVENGEGVCREYGGIAAQLMRLLGLKASREFVRAYWEPRNNPSRKSAGAHAVVGVQIGGKRLLMEPQNDDCVFYQGDFRKC